MGNKMLDRSSWAINEGEYARVTASSCSNGDARYSDIFHRGWWVKIPVQRTPADTGRYLHKVLLGRVGRMFLAANIAAARRT